MSQGQLKRLLANKKRTLQQSNTLIDLLAGFIAQQGAAIIDLRAHIVNHKDAIQGIGDIVMPPEEPVQAPRLVGFDRPKLEIN